MRLMSQLYFKERFIEFSKSYLYRNSWLFLALLFLSFHQAIILIYADFGLDTISINTSTGKTFSGYVDIALLRRRGLVKITLKFSQYLILLLAFQSVPAFIYGCFISLKIKRRAAIVIWLLPSLVGLSTLSPEGFIECMFIYLISPLLAIFTFPGFF